MSVAEHTENDVATITANPDAQQPAAVRLTYYKDRPDVPIPCVHNYRIVLDWDSRYTGKVWLDSFRDVIMYGTPGKAVPFQKQHYVEFWRNMMDWYGLSPNKTREVEQAVEIVAYHPDNARHPLQDYLNECAKNYDPRKKLLDNWLVKYANARTAFTVDEGQDTERIEDYSELINTVGRRWLLSCVARAFEPGAKADSLLILKGQQGTYKSQLFKVLASVNGVDSEFFSDSKLEIGKKDAFINMQGVWLLELPELAELSRKDANSYKAFFTSATDRYRPLYTSSAIDVPRSVVFCGTTNDGAFLKDMTGNRRFWPIEVQSRTNWEQLISDRDQLWGEAVHAYRQGELTYLTPDEERNFEHLKYRYLDHHPWYSVIAEHTVPSYGVTTKTILKEWLDKDVGTWRKADEMQVADIMRSLGYVKRKKSGQNRWCLK